MAIIEWELPSSKRGKKMSENEISVCYSEGKYYSLTFNQTLSKEFEKKQLNRISIKQEDTTGEIYLVVNSTSGLCLSTTGKKGCSFNYKLDSKAWVKRLLLCLELNLEEKRHVLKITKNISRLDNCMTYRIIN